MLTPDPNENTQPSTSEHSPESSNSVSAYPQLNRLLTSLFDRSTTDSTSISSDPVTIDGHTLSLPELRALGGGKKIVLSPAAIRKMQSTYQVVESAAQSNDPIYGINTGFGLNSNVKISKENTAELQKRILRSHATHVGNDLPPATVRRIMALRINTLAKGHSGIRPVIVQSLVDLFNSGCTPKVRDQGTVGASGDLVPLAHIGLALLGEGSIYDPKAGRYDDAAQVLKRYNLQPVELSAKEGLCLINGTQFMAALGFEALDRSLNCFRSAFPITGLSLVAMLGHPTVFDPRVSAVRPHPGQMLSADLMRLITPIGGSKVTEDDPQDPYSFRCVPQVYGPIAEALASILDTFNIEWNSSTDNPLVFLQQEPHLISSGNFHGNIVGLRCDELAIHLSQLSSIAYPRISNLLDPSKSRGLNAFLAADPGLDSGLMTFENVAASLLSEIKAQSYPAAVDSIPTCAQKEDHVAMGGYSARKAVDVAANTEKMLAVELLVATHAIHRRFEQQSDFKIPPVLERLYSLTAKLSPPMQCDRFMEKDFDAILALIETGNVWRTMPDDLQFDREGNLSSTSSTKTATPTTSRHVTPSSSSDNSGSNSTQPKPKNSSYLLSPILNKQGQLQPVKLRKGEKKFGELSRQFPSNQEQISDLDHLKTYLKQIVKQNPHSCFTIDASQDDRGALANLGRGHSLKAASINVDEPASLNSSPYAWDHFLTRFANIPYNEQNRGFLDNVHLLGSLDLSDLVDENRGANSNDVLDQTALTQQVNAIHTRAKRIVKEIFSAGPEVKLAYLNGDHNNMTAIANGFFEATGEKPVVIYLDHHADCRPIEPGPHSGNWNTQLLEAGIIERSYLVGMNPIANSDQTLANIEKFNVIYQDYTWTAILESDRGLSHCAEKIRDEIEQQFPNHPIILSICGDSVSMLPASAGNMAIGFTVEEVYRFIAYLSRLNICAFNIAELKPSLSRVGPSIVGEFLTQAFYTFGKSLSASE